MMNTTKEAAQPTSAARTVSGMLARAAALGTQIENILADVGLQRLSREAWLRECLTLGGFTDIDALQAARAKIAANCPYLAAEIERTALVWVRELQPDPPSHWLYGDGSGDRAAGYAERIMLPMTVAEASAITAYITAELAPESFFGKLDSLAQPVEMLAPLHAELATLDRQLHVDLRARDIVWEGCKGVLCSGVVAIVLDQGTVGRAASAIAEAARHAHRTELQQAA